MFKCLFAVTFLLFVGCGGGGQKAKTDFILQQTQFSILEKGDLVFENDKLVGTGKLLANIPRTRDDNNFSLRLRLRSQGSVALVTNSSSKLEGGVHIQFSRALDGTVAVAIRVGNETVNATSDFQDLSADDVNISLDVHAHGHIIAWVGSETEGRNFAFVTPVHGYSWGLELKNADVSVASADRPKVEH